VPKAVKEKLKAALCLICTICLSEGVGDGGGGGVRVVKA
jgi:hypothetical protein